MDNAVLTDDDGIAHVPAGVSLTETRRKVFELVEAMQSKGTRVMPPTVYRALNFLQGKGLVHRIESLNAFVACQHADGSHDKQFLICNKCGRTEELTDEDIPALLRERAKALGFTIANQVIELRGQCGNCTGR
jgi:Fur family zinc uptake transcriptional regulator